MVPLRHEPHVAHNGRPRFAQCCPCLLSLPCQFCPVPSLLCTSLHHILRHTNRCLQPTPSRVSSPGPPPGMSTRMDKEMRNLYVQRVLKVRCQQG